MTKIVSRKKYRPSLELFGVSRTDPGWIYFIKHQERVKIGRSCNPTKRLIEAKTWLPDMELVHLKPFWEVSFVERSLHEALSRCWHSGEWHTGHTDCDCTFMLEAFAEFDDKDRDKNSIDFIYWMNGTGFAEFCLEIRRQKKTLPKFRTEESGS